MSSPATNQLITTPQSLRMLHDALIDPETLIEGSESVLPAAVVMTNAGRIGLESFERAMLQSTYRSRHATFDPVKLGRLPAGTTMLGGESYWLWHDDWLIADQINPLTPDRLRSFEDLTTLGFPTETIDDPCLLVSRYGDVTWGHWVGEILPRAIMAEQACPGRFRFVLGERITTAPETRGFATAVLESLAAFGIGADRILKLRRDRHYSFKSLFAVSGIWSIAGMNPGVMDAMRSIARATIKPTRYTRIAILRRGEHSRGFCNSYAVERLLGARKFHTPPIETLSFREQVALFLDCDMVFGAQGSGLINLIFAQQGIKVISLAPAAWQDTYFHPLIQAREGFHADLRGPALWTGEGLERDAPFLAIEPDIAAAIDLLSRPSSSLVQNGMIEVAGHTLPRKLGQKHIALRFAAGGDAPAHLEFGWSPAEANHTWSLGPLSTMRLPMPPHAGSLVLELDVMALVLDRGLIGRPLDVIVNNVPVGGGVVAGFQTLAFTLPPECLTGHTSLEIAFLHPVCISPRLTGHGPDDRDTAISFLALRLIDGAPGEADHKMSEPAKAEKAPDKPEKIVKAKPETGKQRAAA